MFILAPPYDYERRFIKENTVKLELGLTIMSDYFYYRVARGSLIMTPIHTAEPNELFWPWDKFCDGIFI